MSGEYVKVYLGNWQIFRVRYDALRLDSFKLGRYAGFRLLSLHTFERIINFWQLLVKRITIAVSIILSMLLD